MLSRIASPSALAGREAEEGERLEDDEEWNTMVDLEVVAHPDSGCSEISAMDFLMEDGVPRLRARAALAGYVLGIWGIYCSSGHELDPGAHPLWSRNHIVLDGISSTSTAPGGSTTDRVLE